MQEIKMKYRDYKQHYADCDNLGDYDKSRKTITVLAVFCLLCVGLFYWYVSDYYRADVSVLEYLQTDDTVTVEKEDGWNYFRLLLKCRIVDNLFVSASLKTHLQKAEFFDIGFGYTFRFKNKRESYAVLQ